MPIIGRNNFSTIADYAVATAKFPNAKRCLCFGDSWFQYPPRPRQKSTAGPYDLDIPAAQRRIGFPIFRIGGNGGVEFFLCGRRIAAQLRLDLADNVGRAADELRLRDRDHLGDRRYPARDQWQFPRTI